MFGNIKCQVFGRINQHTLEKKGQWLQRVSSLNANVSTRCMFCIICRRTSVYCNIWVYGLCDKFRATVNWPVVWLKLQNFGRTQASVHCKPEGVPSMEGHQKEVLLAIACTYTWKTGFKRTANLMNCGETPNSTPGSNFWAKHFPSDLCAMWKNWHTLKIPNQLVGS